MIVDQETKSNQPNFSNNSIKNIKFKNILVVGAGGIGCELLKCLVQTGFKRITIVDLDKIEKSNLNRQFLFDKSCIGHYKAEMAKSSILRYKGYDQELVIDSHVGNIKDKSKFGLDFFRTFDIILNALDNIDARTYMNRVCMINRIPLVNSGTEGYKGYVCSYVRDVTPCFDCMPKTKKKAFPICSIRSKPEKVEHCVAWAKFLFELLFTDNTNGNMLDDYKIDSNSLQNFQNYFYFNVIKEKENQNESTKSFTGIDISQIIEYEFADINSEEAKGEYDEFTQNVSKYDDDCRISANLKRLILILMKSSERLVASIKENQGRKFENFDKENKDIVNFVYAATCLRSVNFNIQLVSRFKIKEIAGNIIPAIASTNAITAGIQTLETIKALNGQFNLLKAVNLTKEKKIGSVLCVNDEKNENCQMCSANALKKSANSLSIEFNFSEFTLGELIFIVEGECKISNPTISVRNNLLYESDEGLDEDEAEHYETIKLKTIQSFNIKNKDELKVSNDKIGVSLTLIDCGSYTNGEYKIFGDILDYPTEESIDVIQDEELLLPDNQLQFDNFEDRPVLIQEKSDTNFNKENVQENLITASFIKTKRRAPEDSKELVEDNFTNYQSMKKRKFESSQEESIHREDVDY